MDWKVCFAEEEVEPPLLFEIFYFFFGEAEILLDFWLLENGFENRKISESTFGRAMDKSCIFLRDCFLLSDTLVVHPNFKNALRWLVFCECLICLIFCVRDSRTLENILIDKEAPALVPIYSSSENICISQSKISFCE